MRSNMHFWRKVPLPSIVEIKHELRMMAAADTLANAVNSKDCTSEELAQIIEDLSASYKFPLDQGQMLLSRLESNRAVAAPAMP
jgi:hypothetical protein